MSLVDPSSPEPAYKQLAAALRDEAARLGSGGLMPSITDLVDETGLAVGTVRAAIKLLVDEGLIHTVPGRGTYVR